MNRLQGMEIMDPTLGMMANTNSGLTPIRYVSDCIPGSRKHPQKSKPFVAYVEQISGIVEIGMGWDGV
jgi:hypothetical protein